MRILEAKEHLVISVRRSSMESEVPTADKKTDTDIDSTLYPAETDLYKGPFVNMVSNQTSDISDTTPIVESKQEDSKQTTEAEIITPKNEDFIRMQKNKLRDLSEADILIHIENLLEDLHLVCNGENEFQT